MPAKVVDMVGKAASVEWIVTSNEVEALLLEHNLIKQHRPPFNIRLRDDKSYPYIMITMEDEFPRVMFTRQPHRRGNLYFGPFASAARSARRSTSSVGSSRSGRAGADSRAAQRVPCLQFHIKRCPAPVSGRRSTRRSTGQ